MKTKKISKLSLNKITVTRLNGIEQGNILGGVYTRQTNELRCTAVPYCPADYSRACGSNPAASINVCTTSCSVDLSCNQMI